MVRVSLRLWRGVLFILLGLGLAGCAKLLSPPASTLPLTPEPTATLSSSLSASPTAAPVTDILYPPVLLDYTPRRGQEVAPDTPLTFYFDQPMDQNSVRQALQLTPPVEGEFEWPDEATLIFRPKAWAAATRYRVTLMGELRSAAGGAAFPGLTFTFSTLTPLKVLRVGPADGATNVRIDVPVLVAFNRPVVPFNCVGRVAKAETACPPLPLTFTPNVLGNGTWLDTTLYRFDPYRGWSAGQDYVVALPANFSTVEGVSLSAPVSWSFRTSVPTIQKITPANGETKVPLDTTIRVVFSTPMDEEITSGVFRMSAENGESVPGVVAWEDNGAVLVFTPALPLQLGMRYTAQIGTRARAATSAPLENPQTWTFTTVPYPALSDAVPRNGAVGVALDEPVRLVFSGALDVSTLAAHIIITPTFDGLYTDFDAATGIYYLAWNKLPRTEYCVLLEPGIADVYGNVMAAGQRLCFVTGDLSSFMGPAAALDTVTLDAARPAKLDFLVRNLTNASFTLTELDVVNFLRGPDAVGKPLRTWRETFKVSTNVTTVVPLALQRQGGALPTGYYQLAWDNPPWGKQSLAIAVVDRHVMLKLAANEALVWVTDLRSGEPISRTAVQLVDHEGLLIAAGTTDTDGLAAIPISSRPSLWDTVAAIIGEPGKPGFGIAVTQWLAHAAPWTSDVAFDGGTVPPFVLELYTDRTLYMPGQTLYFRGVVREEEKNRYVVPTLTKPLLATLRDPGQQAIYSATLTLSELGTLTGAFTLPQDSADGDYTLEVALPNGADIYTQAVRFNVVMYQKPDFTVVVTPQDAELIEGETLRAIIAAEYDTGLPVSQAQVTWTVYTDGSLLTGGQGTPPRTVVATGQAMMDADGRFLIEIPVKAPHLNPEALSGAQRWIIEASVSDKYGLMATGRAQVMLYPTRFYVQLNPARMVLRAGVRTEIALQVRDWTQLPVANQPLSVTLRQRVWQRIGETTALESPRWVYTDTPISAVKVTSDAVGKAVATVTPPRGGYYIVAADAHDADGHAVHAETVLWVSGAEVVQWPMEEGRITPIPDARLYRVGDVARILVPVSFSGPYQMLMTVERDGIYQVKRYVFDKPNPIIEVPVLSAYLPNVYVGFILLRAASENTSGPDIWTGYVKLAIEPPVLNVNVIPDKTVYAPGEEVKLTVRVLDTAGQPVDAEVGVAVVTESRIPSSVEALYSARPLRVMSGDGLLVSANRTLPRPMPEVGGLVAAAPTISTPALFPIVFPALAAWEAQSRTDLFGEVHLTFTLPETLTTWVAEVRAVTVNTRVGDGRAELHVTSPLQVRPVLPQPPVVGDRVEVAAIIANHTAADVTVTARLAVGAEETPMEAQHLTVAAGSHARVAWMISVPQNGALVYPLIFSVEDGTYRDVQRLALPVRRYLDPDVANTVGVLDDAEVRSTAVLMPASATAASALTVRIQPTLFGAMLDSLPYLEDYPYPSTDVLVGRLWANVLVYSALQEQKATAEVLSTTLRTSVTAALEHLYSRQNPDGGWGWLEDEPSTFHLTAYAVLGLTRAKQAGFAVQPSVFVPALAYVTNRLAADLQGEIRSPEDAFALYVLSEAGARWPAGAGTLLYVARESLGRVGRAYLLLAIEATDLSDTRIPVLIEALRREVQLNAGGAYWESESNLYWSCDTVLTALAIEALARFVPTDPLLPQAIRWLMLSRQDDHWSTTYATAWALNALRIALSPFAGGDGAFHWKVTLNGTPLAESTVQTGTLALPLTLRAGLNAGFDLPALLSRDDPNLLEISRTVGTGQLYYTTRLEVALPVESLMPEDRGFVLRREYCAVTDQPADARSSCRPVTLLHSGEVVEVRLTLLSRQPYFHVLLEDPYPAGLAPLRGVAAKLLGAEMVAWADVPFVHRELRADRAVFISSEMAPGTYRITYRLRAVRPGTYKALPATVTTIYDAEVWGRSAGQVLIILPGAP